MFKKRVANMSSFQTGSSQRFIQAVNESGIKRLNLIIEKRPQVGTGKLRPFIHLEGVYDGGETVVVDTNDLMLMMLSTCQDEDGKTRVKTNSDVAIIETRPLTDNQHRVLRELVGVA